MYFFLINFNSLKRFNNTQPPFEVSSIVKHSVNVLFSATPHLPAVFQPVMRITQKNDFPSLIYILI